MRRSENLKIKDQRSKDRSLRQLLQGLHSQVRDTEGSDFLHLATWSQVATLATFAATLYPECTGQVQICRLRTLSLMYKELKFALAIIHRDSKVDTVGCVKE
ncbi:hypothetical protein F8N49_25300 [Pseudomonas sp. GXM4]|uniref:hypothetical protein n=1 Tax=Pseudomonas sp. GXM4 TaxID=2651867 RepID=UPI00124F3CDE|nr:hypothetical protein [Pseudomonas sp. GXM4]KAB2517322.1 hypothetical protein F8N49_25300 [Pseudomonas sp. GXM4]CAH0159437.1 hypothetical protein SRABI89_00730 [Pseudomonas koreensis]